MISNSLESNFTSVKPAVEFVGLEDVYSYNENLNVKYKLNDYTPQEGDRIAIFKVGWTYVKDYILFEWAPTTAKNNGDNFVVFNKHILPKNSTELYQICYIGSENEIHGASSTFQFNSGNALLQSTSNFTSMSTMMKSTHTCSSLDKDEEIRRLKEENMLFKESLKAVIAQKNSNGGGSSKNYDSDIQELREMVEDLKVTSSLQLNEINVLKSKIVECSEMYRKMYLEKMRIEKRYENLKSNIEMDGVKKLNNLNVETSFDLGELESIPPFPSCLK